MRLRIFLYRVEGGLDIGDELGDVCPSLKDGVLSQVEKATNAHVAQLAEHVLGKDEVTGSSPVMGSAARKRA